MSIQDRCRKSGPGVQRVPALIIDSTLDGDHKVTPSALLPSITEEVEIRDLGWVSHLLFNHHDPQMQSTLVVNPSYD